MKKFVCEVCGSHEYVEEKGNCRCAYCNAMYKQEYLDRDEMVRIAENAVLADHKRELYDLVKAKYSDGDKIIDACKSILRIEPEDRYAQFYFHVYRGYRGDKESLEKVDEILLNIDVNNESNRHFVQDVLDCMIKNIKSDEIGNESDKNNLALGLFLDRLKESDLLDKKTWHEYQTAIEAEITNLRNGVYNVHKKRDAFIMYSSQDIEKVYELVKYLEEKRNTKCFVAARNLRHGGDAVRDFENQLHTAIAYCDVMVFVSSKNSCSEHCGAMDEVRYVLEQERKGMPKKPRVEYLLGRNQKTREVADVKASRYLNEFFYGKQWCLDKSQLANAIIEEQENLENGVSVAAAAPIKKDVKYCKECGAENDKKVKFCGECGNREFVDTYEAYEEVKRATTELKYCKECGAENDKKVRFCGECGAKEFVATQEEYAKIKEEEAKNPTQEQIEEWYEKGLTYYEDRDYTEVIKWLRKAAEQGHTGAQCLLGICYENGDGVKKDETEATNLYQKAAEQGYSQAQFCLGASYYLGNGVEQDFKDAVKWWQKAAEQGHVDAQYHLGNCYYRGRGIEKNAGKAFTWYRKAAEQDFADAQYQLGSCYESGDGVAVDFDEAMKWYEKALENGNEEAQKAYDRCLNKKLNPMNSVSSNPMNSVPNAVWEKVVQDLSQYGHQAETPTQAQIEEWYQRGEIEKDGPSGYAIMHEDAFPWYQQAAQYGHAKAQAQLGTYYEWGSSGIPKDYEEAVKWYRKSAEQGCALGQYRLGNCYKNGTGVQEDYQEAVKWYRKSAEQRYGDAQVELGKCYENGYGVPEDIEEAKKWYKEAIDNDGWGARIAYSKLKFLSWKDKLFKK